MRPIAERISDVEKIRRLATEERFIDDMSSQKNFE
jgi:hypothetical protein